MQLSEFVRKRMGWCPNSSPANVRSTGTNRDFPNGSLVQVRQPSGGAGQGTPWDRWYEHTQIGTVQIVASIVGVVVILLGGYVVGMYWFLPAAAIVLMVSVLVFGTLTVSVCDDALRIRFGPLGLIRKSWPVVEIASASAVQNPWYYGWGIRPTPKGTLYNIAGTDGIEVRMLNGQIFRIGTDEPEALCQAIELSRSASFRPVTEKR